VIIIITPSTTVGQERIIVFRPDGAQGTRIGIALTPETMADYSQTAQRAKAEGLSFTAFLKALSDQGIKTFDASSL